MGIIYCVRNIINEKKYVGKTVQSLEDRWKAHVSLAYSERGWNIYFYNAIRKYKPKSFELSILETVSDESLLNDAERKWIAELKTTDHLLGYNSTQGGEGFASGDLNPNRLRPKRGSENHSYGVPVPPEVREKISKTLTGMFVGEKNPFFGRTHSEETKKHIGDIQRGTVRGPHSEETKEKIRQSMMGREFTPEWIDKLSKAKLGKKLSPKHRANLSEAQKNRRSREAEAQSKDPNV